MEYLDNNFEALHDKCRYSTNTELI